MSWDLEAKISRDLSLPLSWVHRVLLKAPYSYKVYTIPKRSGGRREIAQPSRKTKALQYWVMDSILSEFPVSDSAMAYVEGRGIKLNAQAHAGSAYLAKFDFKDFFPSIRSQDFELFVRENDHWGFSDREIQNLSRICFRRSADYSSPYLSIGAPSSPVISNILMKDFDDFMSSECDARGVVYTRYADDITFSSNVKGQLFEFSEIVSDVLGRIDKPSLVVNEKKTVFVSKKYQRRVTGLVVNNDGNVSIGRKKKREVKALVHNFVLGQLSDKEVKSLGGYLAFIMDVEEDFFRSLCNKYGEVELRKILSYMQKK